MVKFLKFVLFVVIIVFAFALGVKFSDSFKGNLGGIKNDEIRVDQEMENAFKGTESKIHEMTTPSIDDKNSEPLTEEEKQNINEEMPEFVDIEIVEPMDNIHPSTVDGVMQNNGQKTPTQEQNQLQNQEVEQQNIQSQPEPALELDNQKQLPTDSTNTQQKENTSVKR